MLELIDVSFIVKDKNTKETKIIIDNINLKVNVGSFIVITGPNGSGKSSLAKLIIGVEKPTKGKILFNGEDITKYDIEQRAKLGIGFSFQQPVRFKGLTVKNLLDISANKKLTRYEACKILNNVGLNSNLYLNRELDESLSGGEIKRVEIASLIARKTKLSLFDEPEAGIDIWSFNNLIQIFTELRTKNDSSIIIISHQERILEIADKIIILDQGKIKSIGTNEEILPKLLGCSCEVCEMRNVYE